MTKSELKHVARGLQVYLDIGGTSADLCMSSRHLEQAANEMQYPPRGTAGRLSYHLQSIVESETEELQKLEAQVAEYKRRIESANKWLKDQTERVKYGRHTESAR